MKAAARPGEDTRMSRPTPMRFALEVGHKRAANLVKDLLVELCRIQTANVVGFENIWIHSRLYSAMDVVSPSTPPRS